MSDQFPSLSGVPNHSGASPALTADQRTLALQEFAGEVLEAFDTMQVAKAGSDYRIHRVTQGKSHSWPEIWKAIAQNHVPGEEIDAQVIKHGERLITIDDLDVAPVFVADIDEMIMHYDSRAPYAHQLGQALANLNEGNFFRSAIAAANETTQPTNALDPGANEKDGNRVRNADISGTDIAGVQADLFEAVYVAAQTLDERDVPDMDDRKLWVAPAQYYLAIAAGSDIVNRDFGGEGSVQRADIRRIANIEVCKSNNLRKIAGTDETVATGTPPAGVASKYLRDNTNTIALITHRDAVGCVELLGMQTQSEYSVRLQGSLLVARKANGYGTLRPESAVELASA